MKTKYLFAMVILAGSLIVCPANLYAENIDPNEDSSQYAYDESVGCINLQPDLCVTGML